MSKHLKDPKTTLDPRGLSSTSHINSVLYIRVQQKKLVPSSFYNFSIEVLDFKKINILFL